MTTGIRAATTYRARLDGRVAVVTGAGSGIGRATAIAMSRGGAAVVMADNDQRALEAGADEIEANGGQAFAVVCDVADGDSVRSTMRETSARFGRLDILVANAGITCPGTVMTVTEPDWDRVFAVNVRGVFLCCRHALTEMVARHAGVILITASAGGFVGAPRAVAYAASKAALIHMARCIAIDHAADGVRVNCVCPGSVRTRQFEESMEVMGVEPAQVEAFIPLARIGEAAEVAELFCFLASDAASYITGQAFAVDGGQTAGLSAGTLAANTPHRRDAGTDGTAR